MDATNLCQAEISIITSISRDHTQYLGEDLKQIAFEKASIIKESGTVFAHIPDDELFEVVNNLAKKCSAKLYRLGVDFHVATEAGNEEKNIFNFEWGSLVLNNLTLPLLGSYQRDNAGLALSACLVLKESGLIIEEKHLIKGLETVSWEADWKRFPQTQQSFWIVRTTKKASEI